MSSEFKETSLKEVADVFTGYPFKSKKYLDDGDLKVLRGLNVKEKEINWDAGAKYWDAEFDQEEYYLEEGDIVIGMDGSKIGLNFAHLKKSDLPAILAQRVARIRAKENISQKYVRYAICNVLFTNYVNAVKTGSSIPHISKTQIENYTFPIPDSLTLQEKIAENLAVIDQKIHLNQQINETLEAMAQAIFKSWFVDFDPVSAKIDATSAGRDPNRAAMAAIAGVSLEQDWDDIDSALQQKLDRMSADQRTQLGQTAELFPDELVESEIGEVPKGWGISEIGKEVNSVGGTTPRTKNPEYWDGGKIAWTTPKDLSNANSKILLDTDRKITDEGLDQISSGLLPINTVLMSSRAPVGYLALAKIPVAINQGYIAMICDQVLTPEYVLHWTESNMDMIKQHAGGSTFSEISKRNFRPLPVLVPSEEVLNAYSEKVGSLYDLITANMKENITLENLRDTLLPKLISGEVGV